MEINIAVLLAVHNGMEWLADQVETILAQTNIKVHLYISIDPSEDGSQAWCEKLQATDARVTLLPTNQKFGSAAPNFFRLLRDIEFDQYDYISFSDQDDLWSTDKLYQATKELIKHNSSGYSSNVTAFWSNGQQTTINKAQQQVEWDFLFESAGPGCTFVMTKDLAKDIQTFIKNNQQKMKEVWLHDWFCYAYARAHGYKWVIDKKITMQYRQHDNNQVGVNQGYLALLHRVRFVMSGKALQQSSLLASLTGLKTDPFVKIWYKHSRLGFLSLAFKAKQCRRKPSDRIFFIASCLILSITGNH